MGPGQITDDSEMAMCLLHGLGGSFFDPDKPKEDAPVQSHT